MSRRVAVTGLGVVSPVGTGVADFWAALCAGRSGVRPITLFDASAFPVRIAGEVVGFEPPAEVERRRARRFDRYAWFGAAAALEAWRDAGIEGHDPYEAGLVLGSSHGGESSALEAAAALGAGAKGVSPFLIPRMLGNMAAAQAAMLLDLRGPGFAIASACATGGHAIGEAAEIVRRGDASVMLAGAAEACVTPLTLAGDDALGALSRRNDEPERASRPFDRDRDGFVLAEGAAALVLEDFEHARRRGARVYAELAGYGATTDGLHETRPDPEGAAAARAIGRALEKAGRTPRGERRLRPRRRHPSGRRGGGPGAGRGSRRGAGRRPGHGDEVDDGAHAGRLGGGPSRRGGQGHRVGNGPSDDQLRAPRRRPVDRLRAGRSASGLAAAGAVQRLRFRGAERGAGVLGASAIDANGAAEATLSLPREPPTRDAPAGGACAPSRRKD